MEIILDTNALSAFADGVSEAVVAVSTASSIAIPVIVLGEYRFGLEQSRHRLDYAKWLDRLLPIARVLDISDATARNYAQIRLELRRTGKPIPSNDLWIAALARQTGLSVMSRDAHFDLVAGVQRVTW